MRLATVLLIQICHGCSYFEVNTSLGTKVMGHTMEFGTFFGVIDWKISVFPRKASVVVSGEGTPAVTLRGPFGYVGMSSHSFVADGMNEKGLIISVQTLYRSDYQHCNPLSKEYTTIWSAMLPNWILATFSTVAEVKDAINSGKYCIYNPVPGRSANTHWSIADAEGNSIVLEYERGQPKIYNNYVGVMTNDPFYPWQVENINTYISITSKDASQSDLQMKIGDQLAGTNEVPKVMGHGFNTFGLPGDPSPPSRFVKMFFERQIALTNSPPKKKVEDWLTLVQGILNSIFIIKGLTGPDTLGHYVEGDHTAWATLRIPKTGFYAVRTYENMRWYTIETQKLDWTKASSHPISHDIRDGFHDVTNALLSQSKDPSFLHVKKQSDEAFFLQMHEEM